VHKIILSTITFISTLAVVAGP